MFFSDFVVFVAVVVFYGVWLLWLLVSSPFGVVLVRWLLRFLGFCAFPSLNLYACVCERD